MPPLPQSFCEPCNNGFTPCLPENPGPPGEQGPSGINGSNGTAGSNAFTLTTATFVQPAQGDTVSVPVVSGVWATPQQTVYVGVGGYYAVSVASATSLLLNNLNYAGNAAEGITIASAQGVSPAGPQGATGTLTGAAGGSLAGNYPNPTLANTGTSSGTFTKVTVQSDGRVTSGANLIAGDIPNISASQVTTGVFPIAQGGTGQSSATAAFDALSPLTTTGDLIYFNGTDSTRLPIGTTNEVLRVVSGNPTWGLEGVTLLGFANCDCNVTTDTVIPIGSTKYVVRYIVAYGASVSLTTVVGGLYTSASKGGSALVANTQAYTALTSSQNYLDLTLATPATTLVQNGANIYFSPTTPQGAAATVNIAIYGQQLQ